MGKVCAFNFVTLNGFFEGPGHDISWHPHDAEGGAYAAEGLKAGGNILLFGRATYELMASFWPTPAALQRDPVVAAGMNRAEKIVFTKTLKSAAWNNTRVVSDLEGEVARLKAAGRNMTILGSGSIITQLAERGLIDEYQLMVDPVVLPAGTPIFKGLKSRRNLQLVSTQAFNNGAVLLCYRSA